MNDIPLHLRHIKKINIGCGYSKIDEYLNIDVDPSVNPDILVKDHDLSFLPNNHFDEVLAWDVLEHIPHAYTMHALLDWSAVLRIGGKLVIQTSNVIDIINIMLSEQSFERHYNWSKCLFGNQAHPGDFHHYGFTEKTLRVFLLAAGFEADLFTKKDGWLIGCEAIKIKDWTSLLELDDKSMISVSYNIFLRREIDANTLEYYLNQIKSGSTRSHIVKSLAAAPEHLYKLGAMHDM